jgi:hypothetical protein
MVRTTVAATTAMIAARGTMNRSAADVLDPGGWAFFTTMSRQTAGEWLVPS